jgi:hypothetical protein
MNYDPSPDIYAHFDALKVTNAKLVMTLRQIAEGAPMGDKNPWVWYINKARQVLADTGNLPTL